MLYEQISEAAEAIKRYTELKPRLAIILGSGLGDLATEVKDAVAIPYGEIPHFAVSTVPGHAGRLLIGTLEGLPVAVLQGRFHTYEGHSAQLAAFPVQVVRMLGAETLIVTNAAGGVNPEYRSGDFMLLRDHINFPGMAGHHPLVGPNDERLGPRFPALAMAYDAELRTIAHDVAASNDEIVLHEGIYTMVTGPSFETPAELRFLRIVGTDAVGMSTVPEVIVARHMGMRVLGISLITNQATGDEHLTVNHAEVLATADMVRTRFSYLVRGIVREYAAR
jgi:purine nucleoside phosphorylase I, inosine and guanosine-specific